MGANVTYDFSEYKEFFSKLRQASGSFEKDAQQWLEGAGEEFLTEVQEQIISRNALLTGYMVRSFERGGSDNIFDLGALRLEVGTSLEYAVYANNGHRQQPGRFIPGYWKGKEYIYDPSAKGGMVLKASWVPGKHFFDAAIQVFAPQFEKSFEKKLEEWLASYFGK